MGAWGARLLIGKGNTLLNILVSTFAQLLSGMMPTDGAIKLGKINWSFVCMTNYY